MNIIDRWPDPEVDPMVRKIMRLSKGGAPRVVDLFSGCGGLSLGFHRAGCEIWAGVEVDPDAASSHAVNFHDSQMPRSRVEKEKHSRDITVLEPEHLVDEMGAGDHVSSVDILIGGPPCQSYARIGRAKLREIVDHPAAFKVDPRGNLYLRYLHYARALQPLAILMENVPDVINYGGHNVASDVAKTLDELGYECRYTLLNAVNYGIPQMRERMFLLAYHRSLEMKVRFPDPTHFWKLPWGYESARTVALKNLCREDNRAPDPYFVNPPQPERKNAIEAVSAKQAIGDLPRITDHLAGNLPRGARHLEDSRPYGVGAGSTFARAARQWPGFTSANGVNAHVIRSLPRDYKIFRRMKHGDQYPEAHALANELFERFVRRCKGTSREIVPETCAYEITRTQFVPPYDPGKFPNKWRKMSPDEPARTVMAHLEKDTYSHIHYDSLQARTISVREAARLQSFPDGFRFVGAMNSAFRQIGNAVPPLLAWRIAETIMKDVVRPLISDEMQVLRDMGAQ